MSNDIANTEIILNRILYHCQSEKALESSEQMHKAVENT